MSDKYLAVSYYAKACDGSEMEGCTQAGSLYEMGGPGFTEGQSLPLYYYRKACYGGLLRTCRNLGDLYESNYVGRPDYVLARVAYQKACRRIQVPSATFPKQEIVAYGEELPTP